MASKKGRRNLSAEERALWSRVVEGTKPLPKMPKVSGDKTDLAPPPPAPEQAEALPPFRIGERPNASASAERALAARGPAPPRMDAKAFGRLRRGKLKPEARIDLHGLTAAAAHTALIAFVLRAQGEGKRLVLVITGKGRGEGNTSPFPERPGILRRQVPHWLETPPLAQAVLQVATAHQRHGGSGAYYVYLRRRH